MIVVAKARACAKLGTAGGDRASTRASKARAWSWGGGTETDTVSGLGLRHPAAKEEKVVVFDLTLFFGPTSASAWGRAM